MNYGCQIILKSVLQFRVSPKQTEARTISGWRFDCVKDTLSHFQRACKRFFTILRYAHNLKEANDREGEAPPP